ncbi:hypothetical protein Kfla_6836 [Kribbella flavida DSM 17836]|uniref:TPM domain-containing protein n=1 Tax=Kribbella flavida (strain DSM 17836 / JCM 10339 / NBRC 14399) TaxID=479435 RepID=D2Q2D1_KRIFD|nr:hypothetical protein [Kribbella flavida]ADB35827.1 hypothetical protein Kfla_6836 [Kribbella flavida DSM 17836]
MKSRYALTVLLALVLSMAAVPAGAGTAQTPAERAREIASALAKDPLYIDPAYATGVPENLRADVRTKAKALDYPVYSIILPLTPSDVFQGKETNVLTLVVDALRKPGLYVVVDGGERFPYFKVHQLSQFERYDERLDNARSHALDQTGYDAGPTEVMARFYELLAGPALGPVDRKKSGSSGSPSSPFSDEDGSPVVGILIAALAVLVVLGLIIGLRRRGGSSSRPRREKAFTIPPHVAQTVAAERRRRLTRDTTSELTTLGSELAALPPAEGEGLRHQQAALDAHHAAGKVLDASRDLVDLVGAMVLLDQARREYDQAVAVAAGRKASDVPGLCAFNPLHGRALARPTQVESDGTTVTLPLCAECRQALKAGRAPKSLPGDDGPYWHGDDLWARTFFGNLTDDLPAAVMRGQHRS